MALITHARRWFRGLIFHVEWPRYKHEENSPRGDREAKRRGKRGTDLDLLITKADPHCPLPAGDPEHVNGACRGHIVNTHWPHLMLRDGFRDPKKALPRHLAVDEMTLPQVLRLVAGRWPRRYRVRRLVAALRHCGRLGLAAVVEPKGDPRFEEQWRWDYIAAVADDTGCAISVRALPENASALIPARRAEIEEWEI